MESDILANFVDKILSYSQNRTYSRYEAEELAQEIMLQAVKNISTIQDMDKFEIWLWGVANNTLKSFRRNRGRERAMYSSEDIDAQICHDEYEFEQDEIYSALRKNIAYLSACYRDIIVLHYYDGLTCKEIAKKLNLPEGTVTYRLSVGREKLKKEIDTMQETALKPIKLNLRTDGSYAGTPWLYINDALSKNILWQAYREAKSAEELSRILGVPAFYIEDRMEMLDKCGAITKPTQNTVLTDILIYDESVNVYEDAKQNECFSAVSDKLWDKMRNITKKAMEIGIYTAGKTQDELACMFFTMALDHYGGEYDAPYGGYEPPERFDGWKWEYSAETENYKNTSPYGNRDWLDTDGHTIGHIVYVNSPFEKRRAMRKPELAVCERIMKGDAIGEDGKEAAATAIKDGFVKKSGEKLELNVPYFSIQQYEHFRGIVSELDEVMPLCQKQAKAYTDGYKKLFPPHLKNKAASSVNSGTSAKCLIRKGLGEWAKSGRIEIPQGSVCDVLVEHDGGMFFKP